MLIVIEGLDGSGKSTQVAKLREYLAKKCGSVDYIHFPRYDAPVYGPLIGKFLRGGYGSIDEVHPQIVALLFAEDRHGAADGIRDTLSKGGTVLLDRYVYSNVAYQCAKLSDPEEKDALKRWIIDTEFGDFGIPKPDLNIFLDVPIDFVRDRLSSSRQGGDRDYLEGESDIHEADISFQQKVRSIYSGLAEDDSSFRRVDCSSPSGRMLPPDIIFHRVKSIVDQYLIV